MWRQENPDADLQGVPGDFVTASGSGLDPHITLANTQFQMDRVAAKWANDTSIRSERSGKKLNKSCRVMFLRRLADWLAKNWLTCWKSIWSFANGTACLNSA
jgi:K+-transporting ATPase c subunit